MITAEHLKAAIRDVPDFPKKGILFKDITPILKNPELLGGAVELFADRYHLKGIDYVVGIEARGFILASALAVRLGAGFIPVRKPGKLPCPAHRVTYELEYGKDSLEVHQDAIEKGKKVLILDDLLATGGTAGGASDLVERCGGRLVELAFLVELDFLQGRKKLAPRSVFSLIHF